MIAGANIDQYVYNGRLKMTVEDMNFMTRENEKVAMKEIKLKNSEGNDGIPQRILLEGIDQLIEPLTDI